MTKARPFQDSCLELDNERGEAYWKGQRLELSPESYQILYVLACAPDKIHTYSDIKTATNIWVDDDNEELVREMRLIKNAFAKLTSSGRFIEVVPRQGYKWSEPPPSLWKRLLGLFRGK